jgi:hypothetical protein
MQSRGLTPSVVEDALSRGVQTLGYGGATIYTTERGPAFGESGKTEFTIFELDCLDSQKQRKLVQLLVWVFGIRKIFPDEKTGLFVEKP